MIEAWLVEILLYVGLIWLVVVTLSNPVLWFAWIRFRARLRMPKMRRELVKKGINPDKPAYKLEVHRMKDGKEVF